MLTGNYAANFVQGLQGEPHEGNPSSVDPNYTSERAVWWNLLGHPIRRFHCAVPACVVLPHTRVHRDPHQ